MPLGRFVALHRSRAASHGSCCWRSSAARSATGGSSGEEYLHYLDYVVIAAALVGIVYLIVQAAPGGRPRRSRHPRLERRPRLGPGPGRTVTGGALVLGASRDPPSSCPFRARRTSRWSRGSPAGASDDLDSGDAERASRWRFTQEPRPALLIAQRRAIASELRRLDARRAAAIALSAASRRRSSATGSSATIERRLGGPRTIAAGLHGRCGRDAARRPPAPQERTEDDTGPGRWARARSRPGGGARSPGSPATARRSRPRGGGATRAPTRTCCPARRPAGDRSARPRSREPRMRRRGPRSLRDSAAESPSGAAASLRLHARFPAADRPDGPRPSPWPFAAYRLALAAAIVARLRRVVESAT